MAKAKFTDTQVECLIESVSIYIAAESISIEEAISQINDLSTQAFCAGFDEINSKLRESNDRN